MVVDIPNNYLCPYTTRLLPANMSHHRHEDQQLRLSNAVLDPDSKVRRGPASAVLHRDLHNAPHHVLEASGLYLFLSNKRRIIDATGGAAVSCIGHGDERVRDAIAAQVTKLDYCHSLFFSSPSSEALSALLLASTDGAMAKAFIVNSGKWLHRDEDPGMDSLRFCRTISGEGVVDIDASQAPRPWTEPLSSLASTFSSFRFLSRRDSDSLLEMVHTTVTLWVR